jgi:hypothetical protein
MPQIKAIAFYLPQYHPIPENDIWWGKGFTEWTNVGKAKPLFPFHDQPKLPGELGYYDLRVPETRIAQADLARKYGLYGFCYWHYWFGNGKQLLEKPFNDVLKDKEPDFPFCLAWANESWKGFAHGLKNRNTLIEQEYPGDNDYKEHFLSLLEAFKDKRYIKKEGKPIFIIYKPNSIPNPNRFMDIWNSLAKENGINGIYFMGIADETNPIEKVKKTGVDGIVSIRLNNYYANYRSKLRKLFDYLIKKLKIAPIVISYKKASKYFIDSQEDSIDNIYPTIIPRWDHTPRSGYEGMVLNNSNPILFKKHVESTLKLVVNRDTDNRLVFVKSWNEWAEGNYMEPDRKYGLKYLETFKSCIENISKYST